MDQSVRDHLWLAIIAGGQGTRLFPISNPERPKQFCQLDSKNTFIQTVIENFRPFVKPTQIIVITTNPTQTQLAREQVVPRGVLSQNIFEISPSYGYAGSMVKAAGLINGMDPGAIIINTPSDQYLGTDENFVETIESAIRGASIGEAVIVGVKVNDLVTAMGCGHAIYDSEADSGRGYYPIQGFVEKPKKADADRLMRSGSSACNTGINVWRPKRLLDSVKNGRYGASGIPTDALMKKLGKVVIAVGTFPWHDCGTLKSFYDISKKSANHKNASLGGGTFERIDCRRSLLYTEPGMELRVAGAEDDAIIFTTIDERPIITIAHLSESQRIKALAEDFLTHEDFLTDDFSFGARNNTVLCSNTSDELIVGFVGVENYAVYVSKESDGRLVAIVSQQKRREPT